MGEEGGAIGFILLHYKYLLWMFSITGLKYNCFFLNQVSGFRTFALVENGWKIYLIVKFI